MALLFLLYSTESQALQCRNITDGSLFSSQNAGLYVNIAPVIDPTKPDAIVIIDLSKFISCRNESPDRSVSDYVKLLYGSDFSPALTAKSYGGVDFYRWKALQLPLKQDTFYFTIYDHTVWQPLPVRMFLTLRPGVVGEFIKAGEMVAMLNLEKTDSKGSKELFSWRVYSLNDVYVSGGSCDISQNNLNVTLPPYPGGAVKIPLSISCKQPKNITYTLTGTTANAGDVFLNTASVTPASGVGIQISDRSGPLSVGRKIDLGRVDASGVDLGLQASYATLNGNRVSAGQVQSVINVTFEYN